MDLRKLTVNRLEQLIAINENKMSQPHYQDVKEKLTQVRAQLEAALEWKLKNA